MVDSSRRMLELLSLLQLQREWPGAELAERLGVSDRTLRRDVEKLRALDYPIHAVKGTGGGYRLGDGARLPPLQLLSDEAVATAIALTTAASSNVQGVGEAAQRALGKLRRILPSRLRGAVERLGASVVHLPGAAVVDPAVLLTVAGACQDQVLLRFDYERGDGTQTRREVEPYGLVAWSGRWYLVAWDLDRADWRTFRVDRLRPRIPLGRRFTPRVLPESDAGAYFLRRVRHLWDEKAVVLVHAPADGYLMRRWATVGEVKPWTPRPHASGSTAPASSTSPARSPSSMPTSRSSTRRSCAITSPSSRPGSLGRRGGLAPRLRRHIDGQHRGCSRAVRARPGDGRGCWRRTSPSRLGCRVVSPLPTPQKHTVTMLQ